MRDNQVRTPSDALAYIIDCTLATVSHQATLKNKSKHEYRRQISIAQKAIQWAVEFGVDLSTTRAQEVIQNFHGSVEEWAKDQEG